MTTRKCPNCTATEFKETSQGMLECQYCGTILPSDDLICPSCGHSNSSEAHLCASCGEALTLSAQVFARHANQGESPPWLERVRTQAAAIKAQAATASESRMQVFMEIERRREMTLAQEYAAQKAHDRRVLTLTFFVILLFIITILAALIWLR